MIVIRPNEKCILKSSIGVANIAFKVNDYIDECTAVRTVCVRALKFMD